LSKKVLRFKNMTVARQQGEIARLRVVGGPDTGVVFVLLVNRVSIGRGEENDIVLTDIKASRTHAELILTASGVAMLHDAGSSNGLVINGVHQFKGQLRTGDKIGIGLTVLEFIGAEKGGTQVLTQPPSATAMAVGTGSSGLTQFVQRTSQAVREVTKDFTKSPPLLDSWNNAGSKPGSSTGGARVSIIEKNKRLVMILAALTVVATLMPEVEKKQREKNREYNDPFANEASRGLASLPPPVIDKEAKKQADIFFKEGFREYREGNYLRAQVAFETALQIYTDHHLARQYLDTVKKNMAEEGKERLKIGKREQEANRFVAAYSYYDSVRRMYFRDQSNPLFKEAEENINELEKKRKEWDR